jgi:hypothetical protein
VKEKEIKTTRSPSKVMNRSCLKVNIDIEHTRMIISLNSFRYRRSNPKSQLSFGIGLIVESPWSTPQVGRRFKAVELVFLLVYLAMRNPEKISADEGKDSDEAVVPE